jgi:rhodanese-related sulfurtransferase/DNA-binding transcriptional ArsR family regulator
MMNHRAFKDPVYDQFARIGNAVASPHRIELLELLGQGEKTVEQLAGQAAMAVKNTSAHLRVLRQARLVETRREGTFVYYRLADPEVFRFLRALQTLGRRRLAEVEQMTNAWLASRDHLTPVALPELRALLRDGAVTVIDVRPHDEFVAGHIPGAISMPVADLKRRMGELPRRKEVIAYCRGPYCVYSLEAVTLLRRGGYRARRAEEGLPDWRARGHPVLQGDEAGVGAYTRAG